jgi:hypothetical protein
MFLTMILVLRMHGLPLHFSESKESTLIQPGAIQFQLVKNEKTNSAETESSSVLSWGDSPNLRKPTQRGPPPYC